VCVLYNRKLVSILLLVDDERRSVALSILSSLSIESPPSLSPPLVFPPARESRSVGRASTHTRALVCSVDITRKEESLFRLPSGILFSFFLCWFVVVTWAPYQNVGQMEKASLPSADREFLSYTHKRAHGLEKRRKRENLLANALETESESVESEIDLSSRLPLLFSFYLFYLFSFSSISICIVDS